MIRGAYGFFCRSRRFSRWACAAAAGVLLFEAGFVLYQHRLQEQFIGHLVEPGDLAGSVVITASPRERSFFLWRDRLTVTLAASLLNPDTLSAPPSTFEFDVEANFGPFGLQGDVFALNTTRTSASLLGEMRGVLPNFGCTYAFSALTGALSVSMRFTPFSFGMRMLSREVGLQDWHFSAREPVRLSIRSDTRKGLRGILAVPELNISVIDPTQKILWMTFEGGEVFSHFEQRPFDAVDREWYLKDSKGLLDKFVLHTGDIRGHVTLTVEEIRETLTQHPQKRADLLDGEADLSARELRLALQKASDPTVRGFVAGNIELQASAENFPPELFDPDREDRLASLKGLDAAGPVRFDLHNLSFDLSGERAGAKGFVSFGSAAASSIAESGRPSEVGRPEDWAVAAVLPEPVYETLATLARGYRRSLSEVFEAFSPEEVTLGRVHRFEMPEGAARRLGIVQE